jgi:hypothetical protein
MSKGHILIVEDNDLNRKLERDVLQHNGYATLEAETAEEAMRLARKSCGAYSHGHLASRAQRNRGGGSVADRTRHARYPGDRGYRLVALDTPGSVLVRPALLAQSAKIREGGVALRFRRRVEQMSAPAKIQVVDDQPQNARRRLCADARPGEILITERVASTLEAVVESEPRGCRQFKGLHHPVPVYRVLWLKSAQPF